MLFVFLAGALPAQEMNLRDAIAHSARGVEEAVPQGTKLAVLNFDSPAAAFSDYVIEELTGALATGRKVAVVDRRNLALIAQEMNLQLSGDVSDESAQEIGRILGAQSIVSGTLTNMGNFYRFRIRLIEVETAFIQTQIALDLYNDTQVAFLLGGEPSSAPPPASVQSGRAANAVNNWFSAELSFWLTGAGARYERMLGSQFSLGVNAYAAFIPRFDDFVSDFFNGKNFVIDIPFRWYPAGKLFFVGVALGFHYFHTDIVYGPSYDLHENGYWWIAPKQDKYGFIVSPEIGMKIDIGRPGGFYLEPGVSCFVSFGKMYFDYGDADENFVFGHEGINVAENAVRACLGMGWGF